MKTAVKVLLPAATKFNVFSHVFVYDHAFPGADTGFPVGGAPTLGGSNIKKIA